MAPSLTVIPALELLAKAPPVPTDKVPAFTVVVPVYVLAPVYVKVPAPALVTLTPPEMIPEMVLALLFVMFKLPPS